jgi:RNA recognition motif-containing protein
VSLLKVFLHFHDHKKRCFSSLAAYAHTDGLLSLTVKIIMDKISKRSQGYAFIEYATEEAASAALKEMNGKVSQFASFPSPPILFSLKKG